MKSRLATVPYKAVLDVADELPIVASTLESQSSKPARAVLITHYAAPGGDEQAVQVQVLGRPASVLEVLGLLKLAERELLLEPSE